MNEPHVWGNNCLPSFEGTDLETVLQKLKALHCPIVFPVTVIGSNQVLEFLDSEGNQIEVTCPLKKQNQKNGSACF
jgi:predicted enzyme related to lactoylglutathione lyase